ncbi:hypothetical protein ACSSUQ_004218 [Yersinia enterocolitica]
MTEKTIERTVIDQLLKLKVDNEKELLRRIEDLRSENERKDEEIFHLKKEILNINESITKYKN